MAKIKSIKAVELILKNNKRLIIYVNHVLLDFFSVNTSFVTHCRIKKGFSTQYKYVKSSQNRPRQNPPQSETQSLLQNEIEPIIRKMNLLKDILEHIKKGQNLLRNGLKRIAKMQSLSQNDLDQIKKMQNLSRNELKQIAKTRRIKKYKKFQRNSY